MPIARHTGCLAFALVLAAGIAPAEAQTDAFSGQTIEFISGYSDGSPAAIIFGAWGNAVMRLRPDIRFVIRASSGGSAALATEFIASAPPDGLTLGSVSSDALFFASAAEAGTRGIHEFEIVGSLNKMISVLFASRQSGIESADELLAHEGPLLLATRSTVSGSYFEALLLNALLGTRIRPVTGYDSGARDLALANGEADFLTRGAFAGVQYVKDGVGIPILAFADGSLPSEMDGVPSLSRLEIDPQFDWIVDFYNAGSASTLIVAPKGIAPDRLQLLRDLFFEATSEPQFLLDIAPLAEVAPTHGADAQAEVDRLFGQFDDLDAALQAALACGIAVAETGNCD